jgi:hypothetical protein
MLAGAGADPGTMTAEPMRSADRALKSLQSLPGVGPSIAADLARLGYREPEDLCGENPDRMFERLVQLTGLGQHPMVLDAFRCAVHSASSLEHDAELVKPWVWSRLRSVRQEVALEEVG